MKILLSIINRLSFNDRIRLLWSILIAFFAGLTETLLIFLVFTLIKSIASPFESLSLPFGSRNLLTLLGISQPNETNTLTVILCGLVAITALCATLIRVFSVWLTSFNSAVIGIHISDKIFLKSITQPFLFYKGINSSDLIATILSSVDDCVVSIRSFLNLSTACLSSVGLVFGLALIDFKLSVIVLAVFSSLYLGISCFSRPLFLQSSRTYYNASAKSQRHLNETFASIKCILLEDSSLRYLSLFSHIVTSRRLSLAKCEFIKVTPRYVIEGMFLLSLATFPVVLIFSANRTFLIAFIPTMVLAAQRLLPYLQQQYSNWADIKSNSQAMNAVLDLMSLPESTTRPEQRATSSDRMTFDSLRVEDLSYTYDESDSNGKLSFKDTVFSKGTITAIVGSSGCGKTTFVDTIMGLLAPSSGRVLVNDIDINSPQEQCFKKKYQCQISHVPQSATLPDTSIENIISDSCGESKPDLLKVKWAASAACLDSLIDSLPGGYGTPVGERGGSFSGGQVQRLLIARAIYKCPQLLILDESTNALDPATEASLFKSLRKNLTHCCVLVVTHRPATLKLCDYVYSLE